MNDDSKILKQIALTKPDELYIINVNGKLIRLECPFDVTAKEDVGDLVKNTIYSVECVNINRRIEAVYKINDACYLYSSFEIN